MRTEIAAGSLRFTLEERSFGNDGGPDIRVYGPMNGNERQLLRFDCFRNNPHYHFDPEGRDEHHTMTPEQAADSLGWMLSQLRERLPELIQRAGGDDEAVKSAAGEKVQIAINQIAAALDR